ncbi:GNAT family N-acetyltransferase [Palleronia sp. LCG004]|uniref:GNAT family N-acetyltransferase n=1 Tax=Palleronia sp. LCG004 TaxID=3079304 RepID=UPI002943219D|nr:GNAT family N-acetyltransferase [Palleronia sp. LCG004]WOI58109.1 GNAT family N-acetyltransferase [Palleronia sp. LCG004]
MNRPATADPATIEIAPFTQDHIPQAQILSLAEGWPHRVEDWQLTLSVSNGVVALDRGRVVATALCSLHGPVATLNMIIVASEMRGRGLGRQVMERVIALAGNREMRLVATDAGVPLYRKLGFVESGRIVQLHGEPRVASPVRPVEIGPVEPPRLAGMDRAASGMEREALLSRIAGIGETLSTEGGFALLRPFGRGHVLGPVVARDAVGARSLIAEGARRMDGRYLRIDVPEEMGLVPFVEGLGLSVAGGGVSMVRAPRPREASEYRTHALISQALG